MAKKFLLIDKVCRAKHRHKFGIAEVHSQINQYYRTYGHKFARAAFPNKHNIINSRSLRCITARGSSSGLSLGGPTNVKAHKSFLFTECSLKVENKEHLFDGLATLLERVNC